MLFTLLPIIFMILIAFTNFDADHQPPGNLFTWVGMTNVTDIFLGNEIKTNTFFGLLGWTIVWAIFATFTNYILGMLLAVAINSKLMKLKQVWRTCFVIAIAIPQFVSLLLISRALEPAGAVNVLLQELGLISAPLPFLLDPTLARIVVVVVNMWIGIPYTMMTFSGVLMNIPAELYESAEMDGRGAGQKVHFHHAALYVLRDGPRDDHYLRDEFQQLQRHIPAHSRRPLLAGLLSGR